jgi:hypothetical protein
MEGVALKISLPRPIQFQDVFGFQINGFPAKNVLKLNWA